VNKVDRFFDMTAEELVDEEKKMRKEMFSLRFQLMTGRVDNPMRLKAVRRDIARLQTVRRQRELKIEKPAQD
jgi:large subunit ribosomal protein L29